MMSVSPGMVAEQAGRYFSREDYYLREAELGDNSRWIGKGGEALGLEGPVGEAEFRALCRGEDPAGNRIVNPRLSRDKVSGELVETRRAGNDCTFSAPKTLSVLYACGNGEVKEAHDAAVLSVMRHIEDHYCHYQSPGGLLGGGLVAAKFDHATSRNIDPQLHSHVFVVNAVLTPEGSWRANDPKAIFLNQKSLGLLYRVELARELEKRGFGVDITDRSQMFFDIKGVDHRLAEHFSSRRVEIEARVAHWEEEGRFSGVPHGRLYEMAALETRDPKREVTREDVARIFERGFEACGTSIEEVNRSLEISRSRSYGSELAPGESAARMVALAARELTSREAVLERGRLLEQAARVSGLRFGVGELDAAIDAGVEGVIRIGRDSRGREFYTTGEMLELEAGNLEKVRALAMTPYLAAAMKTEMGEYWERLALEGVRPTAGQREEFQNEVGGWSSFTLSVGDPGTAKTTTLGFIERFNEEVLEPEGRRPYTVNLACTGKAAREMSIATGLPAFTLEGFLNQYAASKFDLQREKTESPIVEPSGEKILIPEGVPVVLRLDEASLLGARQARELLQVVAELREKGAQVKLHLLGDTKQMQSISAGDFLKQVQELGVTREVEYAHLTEILRQRDPGLLEIAKGLNREDRTPGENAREALAALDKRGELVEIRDPGGLRKAAVEHYLEESRKPSLNPERAAAGEGKSVLMVAATNAQRLELNREARSARVSLGEIEAGRSFTVLSPARQGITVEDYRQGDTVLFTGERGKDGRMQNWGARLGTEGRVVGIDRERNLVRVEYAFTTGKGEREVTRTVTRDFPAAELEGRTALYREEKRNFSVGDRIVALKNDHRLDLQNGTLGVIRELNEKGRAWVDLGNREVTLDLTRYLQVDHAYAVTIHKSQGATVEHSIMVAPVRPEPKQGKSREVAHAPGEESYGRASYNALNVAVTRAQYGTRVFTNSVEGLARSVEVADTKTSTLARVAGQVPEVDRGLPAPGHDLAPRHGALGEKIRRLGQAVRGPGEATRRLSVESIRVPERPSRAHEFIKQVPVPAVQKDVGKELVRSISKGFGMER